MVSMSFARGLAALVAVAGGAAAALWAPAGGDTTAPARFGVAIVAVRPTAGGNFLDFRYRILDPTLAAPLADKTIHPVLVHERTGARFIVPSPPKLGPMRTRNLDAGRIQFSLFANPGRLVRSGDLVSVEMGPVTARHLVVQ